MSPPDEKGGASAVTPTPPNKVHSVAGNKNSPKVYRLSRQGQDSEDSTPQEQGEKAPPLADVDARGSGRRTAKEGFIPESERQYLEIVAKRSGEEIDEETFQRKQQDREKLKAQSVAIADKLESVNVRAYGDSKITLVGLISGIEEELIDFRNIVFIPMVAKRKRAAMLADLEYFVQRHRFSRMWVMTSGTRVTIPEVRERMLHTHRRISKLNHTAFMKSNEASIVFRSSELGSMERINGEATFHIHCHLIVYLHKKLTREQWSELLRRVRKWWKFHFKDAKQIQMAREACKYVVKPNDLEKLSAEELKALYEQLFKMHIVQALGPLKLQRKETGENEIKLIHEKVGDKWKLKPILNWNKSKRKTRPDEGYQEPPRDNIIATMLPAPYFAQQSEPIAIVLNRQGGDLSKKSRVQRIHDAAKNQLKT
ncbi:hypothetical protein JO972_12315 [Verrucomicrobiaceae bacterium 5K15]|uniref:Replication protein n=1 Tax=Oceaniferula flava TaxID=2800421 RepID=A0AAE2V9V0_9BACT|nr:hypothetical protein [Oceaniferula flavus]MBK1855748.1 hypothetical protein [Oceaniferula flavus]MBM1137055.1 hypothetical protein [Oceaniferula flavus]